MSNETLNGTFTNNITFEASFTPKNFSNTTENVEDFTTTIIEESHIAAYQTFIIVEIAMTLLELVLSITAVIKLPRWRRNYRNQILMQISIVRFIKRITSLIEFQENIHVLATSLALYSTVTSLQIYCDFVLVILVSVFIKHMYDTLITVLVKNSQEKLYKILVCTWLLPVPVGAVLTAVIMKEILDEWFVYLLVCGLFRWPLMLMGTVLYVTILFKVHRDEIRHFVRSLAFITFLLCLVINLYLFCKDAIMLWCIESFLTNIIGYILGFILNLLILCLYVILISMSFRRVTKSCNTFPSNDNFSES